MIREPVVMVDGQRIVVSVHAVERYRERVRPGLGLTDAARELRHLLENHATIGPRPDWCVEPWEVEGERADCHVLVGDIAFPTRRRRVITCVVRHSVSPKAREERNRRRSIATRARALKRKHRGEMDRKARRRELARRDKKDAA